VLPYIGIQAFGLLLVILFPSIATWLPNAIGW
jgi:TRAP-type C4-dicarboxylate transport system permease large subunit